MEPPSDTIASLQSPPPPQAPRSLSNINLTLFSKPSFIVCAASCALLAAFFIFSPSALAAAKSSKAVTVAAAAAATATPPQSIAKAALDFILHLDVHLGDIIARYGTATYAILFAIVFAETGLVITPFLPGDSLLFATGALAALGKLNILTLAATYIVAATAGDAVNYTIGSYFGTKAVQSNIIKKEYIARTERFYAKYGGKAIVLARFVPIVRTFAPFVAGVGTMSYTKFWVYNVVGALLWTGLCTGAGFLFGNIPSVHDNFSLVVLGIVVVSVLPVVYEFISASRGDDH